MGKWGVDTSSGLKDNFVLYPQEAWFGIDSNYNANALLLLIKGKAVETTEDGDEVVTEDHKEFWPLGTGWETPDAGRTAEHPDGHEMFHASTKAGKVVQRIIELANEEGIDLDSIGDPLEADTWQNLGGIRWKREKYMQRGTEREILLPAEIVGEEPSGKKKPAAKGGAKKAPAKKAPAKGRAKKATLADAVAKFAADFDDHDAFYAAATASDEVDEVEWFDRWEELIEDEDLLDEISDPDGDFWSENGGAE